MSRWIVLGAVRTSEACSALLRSAAGVQVAAAVEQAASQARVPRAVQDISAHRAAAALVRHSGLHLLSVVASEEESGRAHGLLRLHSSFQAWPLVLLPRLQVDGSSKTSGLKTLQELAAEARMPCTTETNRPTTDGLHEEEEEDEDEE